ncbi:MAG: cytochrome c5 family protein [Burkholderiales bacterium]|nr:cytochrome c5 family protein [Burkholderiales bacterium]
MTLLLGTTATAADEPLRAGNKVYQSICQTCHGTHSPVDAPKLGDRRTWAPLIAEGQTVLTAHAWVGVRGMPARGGDPDLTLEEFGRAVAHMARSAGARWRDPDGDAELMQSIRSEAKKRQAAGAGR